MSQSLPKAARSDNHYRQERIAQCSSDPALCRFRATAVRGSSAGRSCRFDILPRVMSRLTLHIWYIYPCKLDGYNHRLLAQRKAVLHQVRLSTYVILPSHHVSPLPEESASPPGFEIRQRDEILRQLSHLASKGKDIIGKSLV